MNSPHRMAKQRAESVGSTASSMAAMTMGSVAAAPATTGQRPGSKKALAYGGQQGMVNGDEKEVAKAWQSFCF